MVKIDTMHLFFITCFLGINSEIIDGTLYLRATFDEIYSKTFCGSKAIDFFTSFSYPIVFLVKTENINEALESFQLLLQRIIQLYEMKESNQKVVLVVDSPEKNTAKLVSNHIQELLKGSGDSVSFSPSFIVLFCSNLEQESAAAKHLENFVVLNPRFDGNIKQKISDLLLLDQEKNGIDVQTIPSKIISSWSQVPVAPKPIYSQVNV
jgi:hypothetical protein